MLRTLLYCIARICLGQELSTCSPFVLIQGLGCGPGSAPKYGAANVLNRLLGGGLPYNINTIFAEKYPCSVCLAGSSSRPRSPTTQETQDDNGSSSRLRSSHPRNDLQVSFMHQTTDGSANHSNLVLPSLFLGTVCCCCGI
ncbi:hypothetical protein B0T17DRAFT_152048 [Bombardia bombarda]|uniref:Secreted protein n=1 Tax=Bombardia bombarda TaxID=252184 RepID=A0AA39X6V0_9PEZI|nr:hypothetical protein B0T17DRAFT_152048 [Bombardia bombarda]